MTSATRWTSRQRTRADSRAKEQNNAVIWASPFVSIVSQDINVIPRFTAVCATLFVSRVRHRQNKTDDISASIFEDKVAVRNSTKEAGGHRRQRYFRLKTNEMMYDLLVRYTSIPLVRVRCCRVQRSMCPACEYLGALLV
jgi:hypothetical protein